MVLCGHGGGRNCTFIFLDWELRRRLNNPTITAYGFERSMEKRMTDLQDVPQERVGGGGGMLTANLYDVRPALYITREVSYVGFERTADQPYPLASYTIKEEGYVVAETRFADRAAAEAHSIEKKHELVKREEKEKARVAANMEKYKELRTAGKDYYCITTPFTGGWTCGNEWLTEEMAAAKRVESSDVQVSIGKLFTIAASKHATTGTDEAGACGSEQ